MVRDDPTNNVPDSIFSKLGMHLHRRNQHPIGILKNAIYEYFDTNYPNKFDKFDDLCPIVSVKQVCMLFLTSFSFNWDVLVFMFVYNVVGWYFVVQLIVISIQ